MLIYPTSSSSHMLISTFLDEEQCKLVLLSHYYHFIYYKVKLLSLYPVALLYLLSYFNKSRLDFLFPFFVNWEEKIPEIILYSSIGQFLQYANVRWEHYSCQYLCLGGIDFFPFHIYVYCSCKENIFTSLSLADQCSLPKQMSPYQMEMFNGSSFRRLLTA